MRKLYIHRAKIILMKNVSLFLIATLIASTCFAQTLRMDQVPPATANAFKVKFPNGSQPGWAQEKENVYQVGFFNGKKRQTALFDNTGKWLETETEINYNAVPMKVQNAFQKEFEGYQLQEVYEVESTDKAITYEMITFKGAKNYEAVFSAKGELLKKEEGAQNE